MNQKNAVDTSVNAHVFGAFQRRITRASQIANRLLLHNAPLPNQKKPSVAIQNHERELLKQVRRYTAGSASLLGLGSGGIITSV